MNSRARALAVLAGSAGSCASLAILGAVRLPLAWYEPLLATVRVGAHSSVAMDWYTRCVISLAVGFAVFFGVKARASRVETTPGTFRLVLGWALAAFVLVVGFYGWTLNGRRALPEPLPAEYRAR
jgi:hypothetical protein